MNIQIKEPCHQDWNKMSPQAEGRHCAQCNLVVVDFTSMSNDEIKNYFISNCNKKVCGHFRKSQLNSSSNFFANKLLKLHSNLASYHQKKIWTRLAASLVGIVLVVSGCESKTKGEPTLTGDTTYVPQSEMVKDSSKVNCK